LGTSRRPAPEPLLAFVLKLRPETIATLLDAIGRLLALLDAPDDAAALAAGVEREVLWRLVTGPQGATVRQIGLADSLLTHLARAIH
jgi:hypothetical protein